MQTEKLEIAGSRQALSTPTRNEKPLTNWHLSPKQVGDEQVKRMILRVSDGDIHLDDDYRHWSPESEPYAPADVLLQYLRNGWVLEDAVEVKSHECRSCRYVDIYCFTLHRAQHKPLQIPVLANPIVRKLVQQYKLKTIVF